jgi:hypothetical protein
VAHRLFLSSRKQQAEHLSSDGAGQHATVSERDFIQAKRPRGHSELIAVFAFFLTEGGQREFTDDDIRRAYIRAGIRPPKVVAQAIRDAKNRYEYVEPERGRGKYRLTAHGDRTMRFDLPAPSAACL